MYATLTSYNLTQGPQILFCYVNDITNSLMMSMLLVSLWLVITIASYSIQKRQTTDGDLPVSMTLASVTVLVFSFLLRITSCPYLPLINNFTMTIVIAVTIVSLGVLYYSKG